MAGVDHGQRQEIRAHENSDQIAVEPGLSIRKVAAALNVSRQTVRKYGSEATDESDTACSGSAVDWDSAIDWAEVARAVPAVRR